MSCSLARQIDRMGYGSTSIHRINPATKLIVGFVFIITVASYPKYSVIELLPYVSVPLFFGLAGKVKWMPLLKVMLFLSPFAIAPALLNPFFDEKTVHFTANITLSAGWLSLLSVFIRFMLTLGMILTLAATTSMVGIISGFKMLGLPKAFINQLHILYRYLFLLIEEGAMMKNARLLRDPGRKLPTIDIAGKMLATLALRSYERAERIYSAIQLRAHNGDIQFYDRGSWSFIDVFFLISVCSLCVAQRFFGLLKF